MVQVKNLMKTPLVTVQPSQSVRQASDLLVTHHIGSLVVIDEGKLTGILTLRDLVIAHPNRIVADAMTREVVTVGAECPIWEAERLSASRGIGQLVVVDEQHEPVGVVSRSDLSRKIGMYIDPLTELYRAEPVLWEGVSLLQQGRELSVIFVDVDNFGELNKELGHVVCDDILRCIAQVIKTSSHGSDDHVCRYGGDEFSIVSLRSRDEAKRLADHIQDRLAGLRWPNDVSITASIGISGGRREEPRDDRATLRMMRNLVNLASLASSHAKEHHQKVMFASKLDCEPSHESLGDSPSRQVIA